MDIFVLIRFRPTNIVWTNSSVHRKVRVTRTRQWEEARVKVRLDGMIQSS